MVVKIYAVVPRTVSCGSVCFAALSSVAEAKKEDEEDWSGHFVLALFASMALVVGACLVGFLVGRLLPRKAKEKLDNDAVSYTGEYEETLAVAYTGKYVHRPGCPRMKHAREDKLRKLQFCDLCFGGNQSRSKRGDR